MTRILIASAVGLMLVAAVASASQSARVFVTSVPSGASVSIVVESLVVRKGTTPCLINVGCGDFEFVIEKPGYETKAIRMTITDTRGIQKAPTAILEKPAIRLDVIGEHVIGWWIAIDGSIARDVYGKIARIPCTASVPVGAENISIGFEGYQDITKKLALSSEVSQIMMIKDKPSAGESKLAQMAKQEAASKENKQGSLTSKAVTETTHFVVSGVPASPLVKGSKSQSNRSYTWMEIPPALKGYYYTVNEGGVMIPLSVVVKSKAPLYIGVSETADAEDRKTIEKMGFRKTGLSITYKKKGSTTDIHLYGAIVQSSFELPAARSWAGFVLVFR